jgi:hypothetical protein
LGVSFETPRPKTADAMHNPGKVCPFSGYDEQMLGTMDLFENPLGFRTSLPKNMDFLIESTFFVVLNRSYSETEVFE